MSKVTFLQIRPKTKTNKMRTLKKLLYYPNKDDIYCLMVKNLITKNRKSSIIDLKEITSPEVIEQCKVIPALIQLEKTPMQTMKMHGNANNMSNVIPAFVFERNIIWS